MKTKIIVTLGPATRTESALRQIQARGVDFVRVNMSHSSLEDFDYFMRLSRKVGLPFIIDTEGSQVRTGRVRDETVAFNEGTKVRIHARPFVGDSQNLQLRPGVVIQQLEKGDLIHIDFDTLILRVCDTTTVADGYITATAISGGYVGSNKAVVIDPGIERHIRLPSLSDIDLRSIQIGLREGIEDIAVSFVRSGDSVDEVRRKTENRMRIISKIECVDALENLDEILDKSDAILIDRGDLSKEIPLERIPFTQKVIIQKARRYNTEVFVATNLLESMISQRKPTRAEVHDVINTVVDGAAGLTLAAETAIGKNPIECINTLNKLIRHAEQTLEANGVKDVRPDQSFIRSLETSNYLIDHHACAALVPPHGGKLVNRVLVDAPDAKDLQSMPEVRLDINKHMDTELIGVGTYSPLEGFLGQQDLRSVLDNMRLQDGTEWPIPILLDVPSSIARRLSPGEPVRLTDNQGELAAILQLSEIYKFDKEELATKMYGTSCMQHPGVKAVNRMHSTLLAGKIDLVRRRESETIEYELTPKQLRKLFEERGWAKVLGFHTRNVIHRGHEFVQIRALQDEYCDGLLVHPVIGIKKAGDFHSDYIVKSYQMMLDQFYPKDRVVFATFATFSRYAGPREALFTAICRKNCGCSHFIVGRSHTGVGDYYDPHASHRIFDQFPDLGIQPVKFDEVVYSQTKQQYVHYDGDAQISPADKLSISGTEARALFKQGLAPPAWFMRPEISQIIVDAIRNGEEVFVES